MPQKGKTSSLKCEEQADCFFDIHRIVCCELVPQQQTVSNIITMTPYSICEKMCGANHRKNGTQGIGFSTVTLQLLSLFYLFVNFWLKTKLLFAYPPCLPDLVPHDLLFPKLKMVLKGRRLND
jgi:hypothetical protein